MGEVLKFQKPEDPDWVADYVMRVRTTDSGFEIKLGELADDWPEDVDAFRKVAASLPPIVAGLIAAAEDVEPTQRGKLLGQVMLYEDGTADMQIVPFENAVQRMWVITAFTRILNHIRETPLKA